MARELVICAVGDFCPKERRKAEEVERLFAGVEALLAGADLRIVNFEYPLTTRLRPIVKSGPNLDGPPRTADMLRGRFDIALLANNHILDHGPAAAMQTIRHLQARGMKTVGAGKDHAAAERPLVVKAEGFSIAILNECEHEFGVAGLTSAGGAGLRPFDLMRKIKALRAKHDIVLVFTHGGNEMNPLPSPRVLAMNRAFAEAGASVVINTHPHVPQAVEVWKGVPIAYSLGNFIFDWDGLDLKRERRLWWTGMAVRLRFTRVGKTVKAALEPVFTRLDSEAGTLTVIGGEERRQLRAWLREISAALRDEQLVQGYFDAWTVQHGRDNFGYLVSSGTKPQVRADGRIAPGPRNLLTCEAHNELMTNYARLRFEGRLKAAEARLGRLKRWMEGEMVGAGRKAR